MMSIYQLIRCKECKTIEMHRDLGWTIKDRDITISIPGYDNHRTYQCLQCDGKYTHNPDNIVVNESWL